MLYVICYSSAASQETREKLEAHPGPTACVYIKTMVHVNFQLNSAKCKSWNIVRFAQTSLLLNIIKPFKYIFYLKKKKIIKVCTYLPSRLMF